jgi:hypothetical protein
MLILGKSSCSFRFYFLDVGSDGYTGISLSMDTILYGGCVMQLPFFSLHGVFLCLQPNFWDGQSLILLVSGF